MRAPALGAVEFPADKPAPSGITLMQTVLVINEIQTLVAPELQSAAVIFAWDFDWMKPWIGAGSKKIDSTFSIMLWGGLVRSPGMTMPALEATICHEFGHLLGGAPHQEFPGETTHWSSAEGQADWWAATVCLPRLYSSRKIPSQNLKQSIEQAGLDLTRWIQSTFESTTSPVPVSLSAVAPERPSATLTTAYPTTQCRLDTFRQGATCATATDDAQRARSCTRPACWFHP